MRRGDRRCGAKESYTWPRKRWCRSGPTRWGTAILPPRCALGGRASAAAGGLGPRGAPDRLSNIGVAPGPTLCPTLGWVRPTPAKVQSNVGPARPDLDLLQIDPSSVRPPVGRRSTKVCPGSTMLGHGSAKFRMCSWFDRGKFGVILDRLCQSMGAQSSELGDVPLSRLGLSRSRRVRCRADPADPQST